MKNSDVMRISDWFKDWSNGWELSSASIDKLPVERDPIDGWAIWEEGDYKVIHVILQRKKEEPRETILWSGSEEEHQMCVCDSCKKYDE